MKLFTILSALVLSVSIFAKDTPFPLGMKPTPHGIKARAISTHPRFNAAPLPDAADLDQYFQFRTDQQNIGSCGPTSAREVYDGNYQKMHNGQHLVISALDVYQRTLIKQGNFPDDAGVDNNILLKTLLEGSLLESTWPYDTSKLATLPKLTRAQAADRRKHQVLKGYVVPVNDKGYAVMQCIANIKIAPIIGTYWYNNQFTSRNVQCTTKDAKGKAITVTRYIIASPKGRPAGGHDLPATAYDKNMKFPTGEVGGVKLHNHWRGFGDPQTGSAWAPMSWIFNPRIVDGDLALEVVE